MTAIAKPIVPDSVKHLDPDVVVEVLSRHAINVSDAAGELGVASADLRRLLCAKPHLTDMAVEIEERRLDLAEKNIYEAISSNDPRRRDAASMFTIRNSHRARKRGRITTSTSVSSTRGGHNHSFDPPSTWMMSPVIQPRLLGRKEGDDAADVVGLSDAPQRLHAQGRSCAHSRSW